MGNINNYLNNKLKELSNSAYISKENIESYKIETSIDNIIKSLRSYFDKYFINNITIFGSYKRGTILPRYYDDNSDIDIMIVFNTKDFNKFKPETYRDYIKEFAENTYPRSFVCKDVPSIVIKLNHINFDLVPAKIEYFLGNEIYIPDTDNKWQKTDLSGFDGVLTEINKKNDNIVKPVIRLLKLWNCGNNYPYLSFYLEQLIVKIINNRFSFSKIKYLSGFFYVINNLSTFKLPDYKAKEVTILKENSKKLELSLKQDNYDRVNELLGKIFNLEI